MACRNMHETKNNINGYTPYVVEVSVPEEDGILAILNSTQLKEEDTTRESNCQNGVPSESKTRKVRKSKKRSTRRKSRVVKACDYEVEDILGHRIRPDSDYPEFLLKWKGFSDSENTWEPPSNLEGCTDLLRTYIIDKVLYAADGLSQNEQPFLNLLPDQNISATSIISNNLEQLRTRVAQDRDKATVLTTEDETCEEVVNGFTDKRREGSKKKKQLSSQPLQPMHENAQNDELATRLTNSLLEYSNGIVPAQKRMPRALPPSPVEFSPPDSPNSSLVRTNSTSSISDSTLFNLRITPSPPHDHKQTPPPPDLPITCNKIANASVSATFPLQKQSHAKRKIFGLNCLSSKFPPMHIAPKKLAKKHDCKLETEKVVAKVNDEKEFTVFKPVENGTKRFVDLEKSDEDGTERLLDLETVEKSGEYVSQPSISRMPESAASLLYKELLLNWQHELNKQRDGTDEFIIVENLFDRVPPPPDFTYISSNHYSVGVPDPSSPEVSSSLCGCECYSLGKKCGTRSATFCCPSMACAAFAYTRAGKVRVPPGTPIYECNSKCSCPPDCGNKVVQHGRKVPLCIFRTENGRGWGVKTMQPIRAHSFLTEYVGEVISSEEAERRGHLYDKQGTTYLFDLDFDDDNSEFTIDATKEGNVSHFFNHSCQPNLVVYSVWIECLDKRLPRIAFFTTRSVSAGEELTFDYQMNHNQSMTSPGRHKKMRIKCLCGAEKCLGYYY